MTSRIFRIALFLAICLLGQYFPAEHVNSNSLAAPVLKWQNGGCYSSWCETGWYSSPAVADLDEDGKMEVIASAYSIFILDGGTGNLKWQIASGHDRSEPNASPIGRTWPGIVIADIDADDKLEIVTAHSGGYVSVYNADGDFEAGWPQRPVDRELRGLSVADLDGDGEFEIVVNSAMSSKVNTWVYEHNGVLRVGWPQLANDTGYAAGVYNDNTAIADMNGDHLAEIVVPSDVHYICAYQPDGSQIPAGPVYNGKDWGKVGVWEDPAIELRGWGACDGNRSESYRTNFADGASAIADVNGDGKMEIVATGNVYDCNAGYPPSRYIGVYIFNADRSRFNDGEFNWQTVPVDTGAPLAEDYNIIESVEPNPVPVDLDGDGNLEILFASYDGRIHAMWLDKTEHGNWPFSIFNSTEGVLRFASEPTVADLDDDGSPEVIFTSWPQIGSDQTGKLYILTANGNVLHIVDLPPAYGNPTWNGAMAAPTLANIDSDADLEVILNTVHSGVVAYDLPGTSKASLVWPTGRGSYERRGAYLSGRLVYAYFIPSNLLPAPGEIVSFTLTVGITGPQREDLTFQDELPAGLVFTGNLWASGGTPIFSQGTITWTGTIPANGMVQLGFDLQVSDPYNGPPTIVNLARIFAPDGTSWQRKAVLVVNGLAVFLPKLAK